MIIFWFYFCQKEPRLHMQTVPKRKVTNVQKQNSHVPVGIADITCCTFQTWKKKKKQIECYIDKL